MAFDGNGNWIPEFSAKEDRDAGVKILASRFDDVFQQDLKESFEKCLTNDGQSRLLQDFNFNNHKGINVADAIYDSDAVNKRTLDRLSVHKSGDETIDGVKTFTSTIKCSTAEDKNDNSTNVATTNWVREHRCTEKATTESTASPDSPAYIVENYKSGNNWYRVWSDGWIEQGGYVVPSGGISIITFLKPFTTTDYTILNTEDNYHTNGSEKNRNYVKSTTSLTFYNEVNCSSWWECKGY
jgi:hypothetical protein